MASEAPTRRRREAHANGDRAPSGHLKRARPKIGPPVRARTATVPAQAAGLGQWTRSATVPSGRSTIGRRRWMSRALTWAPVSSARDSARAAGVSLALMVSGAETALTPQSSVTRRRTV